MKEKKIQEKNDAINKKPDPEIELQDALMKADLLIEYKEDLNEKEFSNQKPSWFNEIYSWLGDKIVDSKYSITDAICSKKFELSGVIKDYLNITTFVSLQKTLKTYDQKNLLKHIIILKIYIVVMRIHHKYQQMVMNFIN